MKYSVIFIFKIEEISGTFLSRSISDNFLTDSIGCTFALEVADKILSEIKKGVSKEDLHKILSIYSNSKKIKKNIICEICYSDPKYIVSGKTIDIRGAGSMLATDLARILNERLPHIFI